MQAGRRAPGGSTGVIGLENFGKEPKDDNNNIQPRLGLVWDVRGNGKDVIRGGWGIYNDFGYTNSNVLFAAGDASGTGFGTIFNVDNTAGMRNPDGSFYRVGQPLSNIAVAERGGHQRAAAVRPVRWIRASSSRTRGRRRSAGRTS